MCVVNLKAVNKLDLTWKQSFLIIIYLTGHNLDRVFNSRSDCICVVHLTSIVQILPNLEFKTGPKQLLVSLPLNASRADDIFLSTCSA